MATAYFHKTSKAEHLSNAEVLALAHDLVALFLEYLRCEDPGSDILDVRALPAGKSSLQNAFRLVIATESREDSRTRLMEAGCKLARFQEHVGSRIRISPSPMDTAGHDGGIATPLLAERVDMILTEAADEGIRLKKLLSASADMAARRFDGPTTAPRFHEGGFVPGHTRIDPAAARINSSFSEW